MDPPRPIPNRVVKHGSAAGTGAVALGDKVRAPLLIDEPLSIARRFVTYLSRGRQKFEHVSAY
jgi:hypothetical protein